LQNVQVESREDKMTDLSQTAVVGNSWIRTNKIGVDNPINGTPEITYQVERAYNFPDGVITKSLPEIKRVFDSSKVVAVRNPQTGELTGGTITLGEIYALIYSAFWQDAVEEGYDG
jgi:hypothetical protein